MYSISAEQIKMARANLGWSREDLAFRAHVSEASIRNAEMKLKTSYKSIEAMRHAFEIDGLEFLENDGVRRRTDWIKVYEGPDSVDTFMEEFLKTVKEGGREVLAVMKSQEMLAECLGIAGNCNPDRVNRIILNANIKCLLSEETVLAVPMPDFEFRAIAKYPAGPCSYFVYGNKYATVFRVKDDTFRFTVFNWIDEVQSYRNSFYDVWKIATPFIMQTSGIERKPLHVVSSL
jgi:transcriptional regulator with XRE-family HTH domain